MYVHQLVQMVTKYKDEFHAVADMSFRTSWYVVSTCGGTFVTEMRRETISYSSYMHASRATEVQTML